MFLSNSLLTASALLRAASAIGAFGRNNTLGNEERSYSSDIAEDNEIFVGGLSMCSFKDDAPYDIRTSSTFSVARTVRIVFPCHTRKDSCKALREYPCFISEKCKCPTECTPYTEFGAIGAFYVPITVHGAKGIFCSDAHSKSYRDIEDAVKGTTSYDEFDSMIPFLYNVDLYLGVKACKFDTTFVAWFINTFNKYISMRLDHKKYFCSPDGCVMKREDNCKADLLCASCHCSGCHFSDPCKLFNEIIGNTRITWIVIEFIKELLRQVECACQDVHCKEFNTYESYKTVLIFTLESLRDLLANAHKARSDFLASRLLAIFATVPYSQSNILTPATITNARAVLLIPNTAANLEKLVDF